MATRALGNCKVLFNAAAAATGGVKPLTGIQKPLPVSPMLKQFAGGSSEISRCQAVKKVWDYVKAHNLQNPKNKREIICDHKLKMLFSGKDTVNMLQISGLLSPHFVKVTGRS